MNILLVTNMGRSDKSPASGEFVRRQLAAINEISGDGIELDYFEMPAKALKATSAIKRYLVFFTEFLKQYVFSKSKYSVVHVHFFFPTIVLAIAYKLLRNPKVKIVVTFHGNDVYAYQHAPWWYRACHSFVAHSIFVTEKLKQKFYKQDIQHSILCAGMLPVFKVDSSVDKKYDFIFVGTLDKNKGAIRLLEFAQSLPENISLVVVGAGPYQHDFELLSKQDNLEYYNFRSAEQLVKLYQQTKWLVNLSYNESFGLVISEAMACGLPAIATRTDGSLSQISHQENGYIVEQGENIINRILAYTNQCSSNDYQALAQKAQASVEKFLLPHVAQEVKNIYVEVTR